MEVYPYGACADIEAAERLARQSRRLIDRDNLREESSFQNSYDLARRVAASTARACWADVAFQSAMAFQAPERECLVETAFECALSPTVRERDEPRMPLS